MKFSTLALFATVAAANHYHLDITLQESYVGTNTLFYDLDKNGHKICGGQKSSSNNFGQPKWDVKCNEHVRFHVSMDAGNRGKAKVHDRGTTWIFRLKENGPDRQFGCS